MEDIVAEILAGIIEALVISGSKHDLVIVVCITILIIVLALSVI